VFLFCLPLFLLLLLTRGSSFLRAAWLLCFLSRLVLPCVCLQDYREDAREYLRVQAGKTEDEIDRYYIPPTVAERRKAALAKKTQAEQLQGAVALLQTQVDQLQWKVFGTNETEKVEEPKPKPS